MVSVNSLVKHPRKSKSRRLNKNVHIKNRNINHYISEFNIFREPNGQVFVRLFQNIANVNRGEIPKGGDFCTYDELREELEKLQSEISDESKDFHWKKK